MINEESRVEKIEQEVEQKPVKLSRELHNKIVNNVRHVQMFPKEVQVKFSDCLKRTSVALSNRGDDGTALLLMGIAKAWDEYLSRWKGNDADVDHASYRRV